MDLGNMTGQEKYNLALDKDTSEDILMELAKDKDNHIRWTVAENPEASSKILVTLLEYEKSLKEPYVCTIKALYTHKNLPYVAKVIIETLFEEML